MEDFGYCGLVLLTLVCAVVMGGGGGEKKYKLHEAGLVHKRT
jgi:hypothetical protein